MENIGLIRDLTRNEIRDIRKLVTSVCANYDSQHGCLILDCWCYMLTKCQTGYYCKYFSNAVLPLNRKLQGALMSDNIVEQDNCVICGKPYIPHSRQIYCSFAKMKVTVEKAEHE